MTSKRRILVVEDDRRIREELVALLSREGYLVRPAVTLGVARAALAMSRGLSLDLDLGPKVSAHLSVDGDGRGILRVLENLLRNALDHARVLVRARVTREADVIRFEVYDAGPGFGASARNDVESNGIGRGWRGALSSCMVGASRSTQARMGPAWLSSYTRLIGVDGF